MKKIISISCLLIFLATATIFAQNTLTAGPNILSNNGSGTQIWGDNVAIRAYKIDGSPAEIDYDTQFRDKGFGVRGARWDQIDYYQDYQGQRVNASEKMIIDFNGPVTNVVLTVGMMGANEGHPQGETGKWTGYDANGNIIASGVFGADDSALGKEVKSDPDSYGKYPFNLTSSEPIYSIAIEATGFGYGQGSPRNVSSYNNESGNKENNSDFNIGAITYTRQSGTTNNPPIAEGEEGFETTVGETLVIPFEDLLANDTDPDGDPLTIIEVSEDRLGNATIVGNTVEFEATGNGLALFRYTISDGRGGTDITEVLINVFDAPDPDFQAVDDDFFEIREDIGLTGITYETLLRNDIGENLNVVGFDFTGFPGEIEDQRSERRILFTTEENFAGEINFTYTINTNNGTRTDTARITINVINLLDDPIIVQDGPFETNQNTAIAIPISLLLVNDFDPDEGETVSFTSAQDAVNGNVSVDNGNVVFTPSTNYTGQASFTYTIESRTGSFSPDFATSAPILINVVETTTPPSINQKAVLVSKADETITLQVDATANRTSVIVSDCDDQGQVWTISDRGNGFHKIINDFAEKALEAWQRSPADGDDVTIYSSNNFDWQQWEIINAENGYFKIKGKYNPRFLTLSNGNAIVLDENNSDTQLWKFIDPNALDCNTPNNPPNAVGEDGFETRVGETLVIPFEDLLANDTDPDGDPLTIIEVSEDRLGNATIVDNTVEFEATGSGLALFRYTISDGRGGTDIAEALITVLDALDPTIEAIDDGPFEVREDIGPTAFSYDVFLRNDVGTNLRITSFDFSNFPGNIEAQNSERQILFTTDLDFAGNIEIPYTITDGTNSDTGLITITILDVQDQVTVGPDGPYTTSKDTPIVVSISELLANDSAAVFTGTIEFESAENATNGSIDFDEENITFTPASGFVGEGSFTYTIITRGSFNAITSRRTSAPITVTIEGQGTEPLDRITLQSNTISVDGTSNTQQWGDCATLDAFTPSGTPAAVHISRGRIGIKGDRYDSQLDYNPFTNTTERLEINFNRPVIQVSFTLGNLETSEWNGLNETGIWKLLDAMGNLILQGIIDPATGIDAGSSVYRFETGNTTGATTLVLEATAYGSGQGPERESNNSDYSLVNVSFNPLQASCNNSRTQASILEAPVIYPTVVRNTLNITQRENENTEILQINFYTNTGELVKRLSGDKIQGTINVNDLLPGLHVIQVITAKGLFTYKIIKE